MTRYIEQKMKLARVNFLLRLLLIFLSIFSLWSFRDVGIGDYFNEWRFQFYVISLICFIYALKHKFYLYSVMFIIILVVNFLVISSSLSIFFHSTGASSSPAIEVGIQNGSKTWFEVISGLKNNNLAILAVTNSSINSKEDFKLPRGYFLSKEDTLSGFVITKYKNNRSGKIYFSSDNSGIFTNISIDGKEFIVIGLDLSNLSKKERTRSFRILTKFISLQDNPVIIIGNFGVVGWNKDLAEFLSTNGLEIKNPLFEKIRNLILPKTEYLVGYHNLIYRRTKDLKQVSKDNSFLIYEFEL